MRSEATTGVRRKVLDTIAVIDFETTGLSPDRGDQATEIAVALLRNGQIIGRYQSLMIAGVQLEMVPHVKQRPKRSTCQRPKLSSLATFSSTALMTSRMASANFDYNINVMHSRYLRLKRRIVTHGGGNFWTLFPPLIWKVLHAV